MSKELAKTYDPKGLEERLYQKWLDNKYFHAEVNRDKKPFIQRICEVTATPYEMLLAGACGRCQPEREIEQ